MSKIEWTDRVWNPVTGCTKVSAGCKHCYAEVMAKRTFGRLYPPVECVAGPMTREHAAGLPALRARRFTDVQCHPERLEAPLRWRKPARVFVNSMSDLFHEDVPDQFVVDVFGVMALAHQHTFQVLTKRPERMRAFLRAGDHGIVAQFSAIQRGGGVGPRWLFQALDVKRRDGITWTWPPPNVWLGVSVEDQATANARIPLLLQTPAALRFVSYEPALGAVDFRSFLPWHFDTYAPAHRLDWVIVGGESGPKARPCDVEWIRSVVQQCKAANVPSFVKQLGANAQDTDGSMHGRYSAGGIKHDFPKLMHPKGGDFDEFPADLRVREWPEVRA